MLLCTFHISVDFLIILHKACMDGGGGKRLSKESFFTYSQNTEYRILKLMYIKLPMYLYLYLPMALVLDVAHIKTLHPGHINNRCINSDIIKKKEDSTVMWTLYHADYRYVEPRTLGSPGVLYIKSTAYFPILKQFLRTTSREKSLWCIPKYRILTRDLCCNSRK